MPDAEVRHWTAVRDAATACVSIASTVVAAYQGGHVDVARVREAEFAEAAEHLDRLVVSLV